MESNEKFPEVGSKAFVSFFKAHHRHLAYVDFVAKLAYYKDNAFEVACEALKDTARNPEEFKELEDSLKENKNATIKTFSKTFGDDIRNNLVVGTVNNFLMYISDLLCEIYLHYPEKILRSMSVPIEVAIEFSNKEELLGWAIEKKVSNLSYQTLKELRGFLAKEYNFMIISDAEEFQMLSGLVNIRNLLVHNRGVINNRFISLEGTKYGDLNTVIGLDTDTTFERAALILKVATGIDECALGKFSIGQFKFESN